MGNWFSGYCEMCWKKKKQADVNVLDIHDLDFPDPDRSGAFICGACVEKIYRFVNTYKAQPKKGARK